jgi:hypothetical protein
MANATFSIKACFADSLDSSAISTPYPNNGKRAPHNEGGDKGRND